MNTDIVALALTGLPLALGGYAYIGYPAVLSFMARKRAPWRPPAGDEWPAVTITVPCYNEEHAIRRTLERLLALDYPKDRLQILVISDASSDGTDDVVRRFADRGVELLRMPRRGGKTAAENAALAHARGSIIVNTDATTHVFSDALKPLVAAFRDPSVGAASGRDVSMAVAATEGNGAESGYVGYEMWVRDLETRVHSIVGLSGCLYGIRRELCDAACPTHLSRDFASALMVRERGYRAVSVQASRCGVMRTTGLVSEYRRKIRTMQRGLGTLWYKRGLLDPTRFGVFSFMLASHKLARWLVYPALPVAAAGLVTLSAHSRVATGIALAFALGALLGLVGMRWPAGRRVPPIFALAGFILAANAAGIAAWLRMLQRQQDPVWEPTRRLV
jgi:cellulose synthase/poly-beta-1,6-N-acetylglucosamine synthase-like glycosyltransferase